jgi:hypothetical protein
MRLDAGVFPPALRGCPNIALGAPPHTLPPSKWPQEERMPKLLLLTAGSSASNGRGDAYAEGLGNNVDRAG